MNIPLLVLFPALLLPGVLAAQELVAGPLASPGDELNASFTPDGQTVYFTRKADGRGVILVSHRTPAGWSAPDTAPFSGRDADYDPFVTPDGERLFWISNRPVDGVPRTDFDIWMVRREGVGWGAPQHLAAPVNSEAGEFYPTMTRDGTLYFSSNRAGGKGRGDIYAAVAEAGEYRRVAAVEGVNNEGFDGDPFIAADGSYLVFTGWGRPGGDPEGDLYLSCFRDGRWSLPAPLRNGINSAAQEYAPIVSPDGQWLYFTSYRAGPKNGDVYRVSWTPGCPHHGN